MNVLVYAHRAGAADHARFATWLRGILSGPEPVGISDLVLSSFVRVVTNPRAMKPPTTLDVALATVGAWRSAPAAVPIAPGARHWEIFTDLCRNARATGKLIPDAYFAALAIESGSEWITTDGDYARFPGLRWRHPFDEGVSERVTRYRAKGSRATSRRRGRRASRGVGQGRLDLGDVVLRPPPED